MSYNATGSSIAVSPFNGNIASGQGFFVKAFNNGKVTFTNDMRFNDETNSTEEPDGEDANGFDNDHFFRSAADSPEDGDNTNQKIWLTLVNENQMASSILIGYVNGATLAKDNLYDATTNGESFSMYSMIEDGKMVIQGRPVPFVDSDVVPLGVNIDQNGIYNIGIDHLQGSLFTADQDIYLEDTFLGVIHDLRESPYSFTAEEGTIDNRFLLRYTGNDDTLSAIDLATTETFAFIKNNVLHVQSSQNIKDITVYDLTGKTIAEFNSNQSRDRFESDFNFSRSVYLAVITLENGTLVKKKLMN